MNTDNTGQLTHALIKPEHLRRKALVYVRQSTAEQVKENVGSTLFQMNQVQLARTYGWPDHLIEVLDDLGKSGSSVEGRSGWQSMLTQIATNTVGAVFAANISRLSRRLYDFEHLRILACYHQVLLVVDSRVIDPKDANDAVLSQVTATIAQYENRKRAEIMTQARMAKARQGLVVSPLPVGWIKGADGKFEYDPEVKESILIIIQTFHRMRTVRSTIKALNLAGHKIPSRRGSQLFFRKPAILNVRRMLTNPAYAGTYVFGKTKTNPEIGIHPGEKSPPIQVREQDWIKTFNYLPAYMTVQEQEGIKSILKSNRFVRRDRPGRGPALTQGLLECAHCHDRLVVSYHRNRSYSYGCGWKMLQYVENPCTRFVSYEFDAAILGEIFKALKTPPLDMLKNALQQSHKERRLRISVLEAERERLDHKEQKAIELLDRSYGQVPRVYKFAQDQLEKILKEKEDFELKVTNELSKKNNVETEEQLAELCRLASDIPQLWHHRAVTHKERKEILRCVVEKVIVAATKYRIDATIVWKTGSQTPILLWRDIGRHNLIRELHDKKLTVSEIREHLEKAQTSNGQQFKITEGTLYEILRKLGLKPHRFSKGYESLRAEAVKLHQEGHSPKLIAQIFTQRGIKSASGEPWTNLKVSGLIRQIREKPHSLRPVHRQAIEEARSRGIKYRQIAEEFNKKGIPRRDGQPWTMRSIRSRWAQLNQQAKRGTTTTKS